MDDKTRIRCNNCGSEFDEEYIEYYLETDDPESDCIGHCPVCWGKDVAAISIIDPEAIRRECATLKTKSDGMLAALQMALADHMTEAYLHPLRDGTVEAIRCAIANAEKPPCA